jgi:hypothetical protein
VGYPADVSWGGVASGIAGVALALAPSAATVTPPSQPGPWRQVGAAVTSRPGKALHFYRAPQNPKALAVVVTSTSSRTIHVFWSSYCEFESDDAMTEEDQGTLTGVKRVTAYPPALQDATLCYVWVNARAPGAAKVTAAIFKY